MSYTLTAISSSTTTWHWKFTSYTT